MLIFILEVSEKQNEKQNHNSKSETVWVMPFSGGANAIVNTLVTVTTQDGNWCC